MRNITKNLSLEDRKELISETASQMKLNPAVVEKDYWVCLVLQLLFESELANKIVFKGGTSLSKVYHAIERFSEDIDLILDWSLLGYEPDEPWKERSNTKQDIFNKEVNNRAIEYFEGTFLPLVDDLLNGTVPEGEKLWAEMDTVDKHTIRVHYPKAYPESYIRPEIRLEIGPLASWVPQDTYSINSYTEKEFPDLFKDEREIRVHAINAERTFWEKLTILHQEAHRSSEKDFPARYSRHYYDVYMLVQCGIKDSALQEISLLADVVEIKQRFYPCKWAQYENATLKGLKLMVPDYHRKTLEDDYKQMQEMFFGTAPSFDDMMSCIEALELEINSLGE